MSTILVIDDQAISRMILQELVRSVDEDVQVQSFADPVKALEWAGCGGYPLARISRW
jgi:CheY-like chemotaxis protein